MRIRLGILGLVLLLGLGAEGGGCSNGVVGVQDYGSVTGRVIDGTTNQPIGNALVSVGSLYTAYADSQGAFTLATIPAGPQNVTARAPGYITNFVKTRVKKDTTASVGYLTLMPVVVGAGPPPTPLPTITPTP
jgi:hypothetical protein